MSDSSSLCQKSHLLGCVEGIFCFTTALTKERALQYLNICEELGHPPLNEILVHCINKHGIKFVNGQVVLQ